MLIRKKIIIFQYIMKLAHQLLSKYASRMNP
jgi:hypothetical protein